MAINNFDLKKIFAQQFGYTPADFDIKPENVLKKSTPGKYGEYYAKDSQGRDVFMPLTLGGLFLPYVWVSVRGSKTFVETPMTQRRGDVIELINMKNYEFSVKGLHIGHDGRFPEGDVEALRELFERNEAVAAKSILTDMHLLTNENGGQDKVVIFDYELMDNKGVEHVRGYSFMIKGDREFELEIL
jgi:hypothetical protein